MRKTIYIFSEISWSFLEQRHHYIAKHFRDLGWSVVFVERVLTRVPPTLELVSRMLSAINNLKSSGRKGETLPAPCGIVVQKALFLPNTNFLFRLYNLMYWSLAWKRQTSDSLIWSVVDNPIIFEKCSDSSKTIMDIIHNWWEYPNNREDHIDFIERCILSADMVFYDTQKLGGKINKESKHLFLPGVDPSWFKYESQECQKVLLGDKIKVAFFGNLRRNSDVELIEWFASKSYVEFKFYGIMDPSINSHILSVDQKLDRDALIEKLSDSDILILPYNLDEFSQTISPAKYFECLATGKLICSRAKLRHLPGWENFVWEIDRDLDGLSKDNIMEKRQSHASLYSAQIDFAKRHSWKGRLDDCYKFIESHV